jgi:hypothetical protein
MMLHIRKRGVIFAALLVLLSTSAFVLGAKALSLRKGDSGRMVRSVDANRLFDATSGPAAPLDCSQSEVGSILFTEPESGESTGPYLVALAQQGYTGLAGTPTYERAAEYFPQLAGWSRVQICNTLDCLRTRAERAADEGLAYEYLAYGPERRDGVPDEEKYNLPWATQVARDIADEAGKPLMLGYSTKQLHQEAEERGYAWDDPSQVVALLAPHADVWLIQAADEFWRLDDNTVRPILSQRVYPPGPEFRAEVAKWVGWVKAANPDVEIWIQLALQRIGVRGENQPSAELTLQYRDWIADLVDGIYLTPIYGSIDQLPVANREMVDVFECACGGQCGSLRVPPEKVHLPAISRSNPNSAQSLAGEITLVEEGWTDDVSIPCTPTGICMTILPGYYYRIYENSSYPCGSEGYHQFMVLDHGPDMNTPKHLFAKFLGGAVGFWYLDDADNRVYYPSETGVGILTESQNAKMFFRTTVSAEFANGITKRFRQNANFRILVPSYCSHDLYQGQGEYSDVDGFYRWGYSAATEAVDYVEEHFSTKKIIASGGSAGAAGSFYVGKDQENVVGIIMDSQAVDLAAISDACYDGINVFGNRFPCFCPEGGPTCMEGLAPRLGFTLGSDEPYRFVERGLSKPIYLVWNERDGSNNAHLQYDNLDEAIDEYNPGGASVANKVCIDDPQSPPGPVCNLHVPTGHDYPDTAALVEEVYRWALARIGDPVWPGVYLPLVVR